MPFGVDYSEKECVFKMDNYSKFVSKTRLLVWKAARYIFRNMRLAKDYSEDVRRPQKFKFDKVYRDKKKKTK